MLVPVILWIGDSLSWAETLGVCLSHHSPARLQRLLGRLGYRVRVRSFSRSGRTTDYSPSATNAPHMGQRFSECWQFDGGVANRTIRTVAVIMGGVNDPGQTPPISAATTTLNLRRIMLGYKFGALKIVDGQANLPAGLNFGDRYVVATDTSSTGGAALPSGAPGTATISGSVANNAPAVWECRFGAAGERGWGRVAKSDTPATHISRLVVMSTQYRNYGNTDTVSTPEPIYAAVRAAQQAAVAAEVGAVYGDLYNFLRDRIVAGTDVQNDAAWHTVSGNQHLNAYGESLVAQCVLETIQAQSGWLTSLS